MNYQESFIFWKWYQISQIRKETNRLESNWRSTLTVYSRILNLWNKNKNSKYFLFYFLLSKFWTNKIRRVWKKIAYKIVKDMSEQMKNDQSYYTTAYCFCENKGQQIFLRYMQYLMNIRRLLLTHSSSVPYFG